MRKLYKPICIFVISLLLFSNRAQTITPVNAQSTPQSQIAHEFCNPDQVIEAATLLKSKQDATKDMQTLLDLDSLIQNQNIACNGISRHGNKIIKIGGAISLPDGMYKAVLTTTGFGIFIIKQVSGSCDEGILFNVSPGEADTGSEAIFTAKDNCRFYIEPDNISQPWVLSFIKLQN